ncbi:hypothetical protein [Flavihumibacter solisilvae]|uniref:Transmembrane protein n=1 Tax=Flavihumibacter solisilvae TaxID=1349421 RepID=A0A0C1ILE9_9BACT|nr:hypothetical protein [Flavihumibacter solisilvae]KIC95030.1 hypothetical protein OI18_09115 [Flavihumibacter solisilvae]
MKLFISIVLTAFLGFALCLFLPWWAIAIAAFTVAVAIVQAPWKSFVTGFVALFLLWAVMAWWISFTNNNLLADKVSVMILKQQSAFMLVLVTGLIGGLVAGFAALTGSLVRKL